MSSNTDYWVQREQDWLEECEKEEKSWNKAIDKIYTDLSAEIQEEVERFILRFGSAEGMDMAPARRYLSATDIQYYASLAEKYCKQAHRDMADGTYSRDSSKEYFTEQANAEMRRYNAAMKISRLQMLQSQLALKTFNAQAKTNAVMETATIKRAESEFRRQAGILGETVLNNLDMAETLAKASFHGATFSERIWGPHQNKLQTKLNKAIRNMLILGKGAGPFTRELSRDLGVTKREAQRLLTTELARVQVQAQMESMIEAGFDQYTFITNPNCCDDCRELNGQHFSLQKDKRAGRIPPIHPNCRCTTAAYVDEDTDDDFDEAAFDEWSESFDEHRLSWEEWKEQIDLTSINHVVTHADKDSRNIRSRIAINTPDHESSLQQEDREKCKQEAIDYFRSKGIDFIETSKKEDQIDGRWLKQCAEWHERFENEFPEFVNLSFAPKLISISASPVSVPRGANGQFVGYADKTKCRIGLNSQTFHKYSAIKKMVDSDYKRDTNGVRNKSSDNLIRTFIHEYGHFVGFSMNELLGEGYEDYLISLAIEEYRKKTKSKNVKMFSDLGRPLSENSTINNSEAFAEAFSDFFGSTHPSKFGEIFGKILIKELKRWGSTK